VRLLILGGEGMLGHKVFQVLTDRFETYATFKEIAGTWKSFPIYSAVEGDRTIGGVNALDLDSVARAIARARPAAVINCIGIIKQMPEAADISLSLALNALFPHRLADLCATAGSRLLHISTDCVFSGRKGNYSEDDITDAEDLYGRTKALGEVSSPGCLTIRTSIIGRDFLKQSALLEWFLANRGRRVRGYQNAIYTGLTTQALARIMGDIIMGHPGLNGIFQIASRPISKLELLVKIRDAMKLDVEVEPHDDPPCDRSLSAARFVAATGYRIPTWDDMIAELAADPTPYDEWRRTHGGA
jgi:dTDP-4-dehydrorhamnose reductase